MCLTTFPAPVEARLTVTICFGIDGIQATWSPAHLRRLTVLELARYRQTRARLMRVVADLNGPEIYESRTAVFAFGRRAAA